MDEGEMSSMALKTRVVRGKVGSDLDVANIGCGVVAQVLKVLHVDCHPCLRKSQASNMMACASPCQLEAVVGCKLD